MSTTKEQFHASLTARSREMAGLAKGFRRTSPVYLYFSAKSTALKECADKSLAEIMAAFEALRMKLEGIEAFTRPEQDSMSGSFDGIAEAAATAELFSRSVTVGEEPLFALSPDVLLRGFEAEVSTRLHQSQKLLGAFPELHSIHWYFYGKVSGFLHDKDIPQGRLRDKCKTFRWSSWVRVDEHQRVSTRFHMLGVAAVMMELMALNHREERRQKLAARTAG